LVLAVYHVHPAMMDEARLVGYWKRLKLERLLNIGYYGAELNILD